MKIPLWMIGALLAGGLSAQAQEKPKPDEPPPAQAPAKPDDKEVFAPDIKGQALWDGRKVVPFKAMDFPKMVKAADADFMDDDEYILGLTMNGESRAYPTRFMQWHHIVNDKVGKNPDGSEAFVTVTY